MTKNWDLILSEVEKCDLLCANCHRILHSVDDYQALRYHNPLGMHEEKPGLRDYVKTKRKENKVKALALLGSKCKSCGFDNPIALDFHHRDPSQKDFKVSAMTWSWARIEAEVNKCDLLCAVCHRLAHAAS